MRGSSRGQAANDLFIKSPQTLLLLILVTGLAACQPAPATATVSAQTAGATAPSVTPRVDPTSTPKPAGFKIVGYFTNDGLPEQIRYDLVTHLNYAFVLPKPDGTFDGILNDWKLVEVVKRAHARQVKVLVSVGGWGLDAQFEALAGSRGTRQTFEDGLLAMVDKYQLDGADIDWEYPRAGVPAQNYLQLMGELAGQLHAKGKLLTSAVAAGGENGDAILNGVFAKVDFLNLMAYDKNSSDHSPYSYAEESLAYWAKRGLPQDKMVLGVPFYSRPGEAPYRKLVSADPRAAQLDEMVYNGGMEYYNGIATMRKKTVLAQQKAGGIMFWNLWDDSLDDTSLLKTIYDTAHGH